MTKSFLDWIGRERETKRKEFWKRYEEHVLRTFLFFFLFETRSVEYRSGTNRTNLRPIFENQGISDQSKNMFDWSKFWKTEFFEKQQKIMQNPLNPNNFMNEMHENEFKSFSKTFVFNLELQKQDFHTFYPQNFNQWTYFVSKS